MLNMRKKVIDERLLKMLKVISGNIVRLRGKGMVQKALAKKAGVSKETIIAIENQRIINLESLIKIADALGVSPADLFITDEIRIEVTWKLKMLADKLDTIKIFK